VRAGDLVRRCRDGGPIDGRVLGLVLGVEARSLAIYTEEHVEANPIRRVVVLQADGQIKKWWAVHAEVISEATV
jgi:hypothetical protein